MSEWTPQQFRGPADPSDGNRRLAERLADTGRQMRDGLNHLLQSAGIKVEPGKLIIEGDLEVPNGVIKNDWLESPIEIGAGFGNADGFTLTTTVTDLVSFTVPIPTGYSRALVRAKGMIFAFNGSASDDFLYTRIWIDAPTGESAWSRQLLTDLDAGNGASMTVFWDWEFTGLSGGNLTIRQDAKTAFASIAHASNGMSATADVTFLR